MKKFLVSSFFAFSFLMLSGMEDEILELCRNNPLCGQLAPASVIQSGRPLKDMFDFTPGELALAQTNDGYRYVVLTQLHHEVVRPPISKRYSMIKSSCIAYLTTRLSDNRPFTLAYFFPPQSILKLPPSAVKK